MQLTVEFLCVSSSLLQGHQEKQSRRWTAMKENSAITVTKAFPQAKTDTETGDVSSLDIQWAPVV